VRRNFVDVINDSDESFVSDFSENDTCDDSDDDIVVDDAAVYVMESDVQEQGQG
jgi:hypothetical protein